MSQVNRPGSHFPDSHSLCDRQILMFNLSVSAAASRSVGKGREGSRQRRIPRSGFLAGRLRPHILAGTSAIARASSILTVPAGGISIGGAATGRTAAVSLPVLTAAAVPPAITAIASAAAVIVPASAVSIPAASRPVSSSAAA